MRSGELNISKEGIEQLIRLIRINQKVDSNIKRGVIMSCGVNANEIVKYIASNEGIEITTTDSKGKIKERDFFALILDLETKFSSKTPDSRGTNIMHNLRQFKNYGSHFFDIKQIQDYETDAVRGYDKLERWFLDEYLSGKYEDVIHRIEEDLKKEKKSVESVKKKKEFGDSLVIMFVGVIIFLVCYAIFGWNFLNASGTESSSNSVSIINKEQVNKLMNDYYESINSPNYNAFNFFDYNVRQFINAKNLTPDSINRIHANNTEFIGNNSKIIDESIELDSVSNNISYWHYRTDFLCFRNKRQQWESCIVPIFIELNLCNKLVSYKEGKAQNLKFTDKKPVK